MDKPTHFRRCHVCDHITNVEAGRVERCFHCKKALAPFYYFDDRFSIIFGDGTLRPPMADGEYSPIQGLTVYWESF